MVAAGGNKNKGSLLIHPPYLPGSVHARHPLHILINKNYIIYLRPEGVKEPGPAFKLIQFRLLPLVIFTHIAQKIFLYLLSAHR